MTDPRVDHYIERAPAFARPILEHLRKLVHRVCPEIVEDIKWSRPCFLYRDKITFSMAAFKAHCSFGFWHPGMTPVLEQDGYRDEGGSGSLGRITDVSDLPSDKHLLSYIRKSCKLVESDSSNRSDIAGSRPRKRTHARRATLELPHDFAAALKGDRKASQGFGAFSPSHKREYVVWINEARRPETRQKRIATAIGWIREGKSRNWKYR